MKISSVYFPIALRTDCQTDNVNNRVASLQKKDIQLQMIILYLLLDFRGGMCVITSTLSGYYKPSRHFARKCFKYLRIRELLQMNKCELGEKLNYITFVLLLRKTIPFSPISFEEIFFPSSLFLFPLYDVTRIVFIKSDTKVMQFSLSPFFRFP